MLPLSISAAQSPLAASTCARPPYRTEVVAPRLLSLGCDETFFTALADFQSRRFRLTGPGPDIGHSHSFRFAASCEGDGIALVWMLPLTHSGRVRAPWSPTTCTRLLFRSAGRSRFSAAFAAFHRPLSPRGSRRQSRPFTGFRFATPCEAGGIAQVWMLPLNRFGRIRAPWPPSSCARLLHPLSSPVTGLTFDELGSARFSTACRGLSISSLSPHGSHPTTEASRHCFRSLGPVSSDRVLGMDATPHP